MAADPDPPKPDFATPEPELLDPVLPEPTPGPTTSGVVPGGLLAGPGLRRLLDQEDKIFRDGSWDPKRIKGAGYELTLADDWVAMPKEPGSSEVTVARPGGSVRIREVILDPGDTAIVASCEKFCLDFDISALIGPKFRWAALGLQVLHGSTAHPGYGRVLKSSGWEKKDDERLYLVVVNIGPERITLRAGAPIAYIQFFQVEWQQPEESLANVGFDKLTSRFMQDDSGNPNGGLLYFRNLSDLRTGMREFRAKTEEHEALSSRRLDVVEALVAKANSTVELVVVFGVFLVTTTILGVVYGSIVDAVKSIPSTAKPEQLTLIRWLTVLFGAMVVGALVAVIMAVTKSMQWRHDKATSTESRQASDGSGD